MPFFHHHKDQEPPPSSKQTAGTSSYSGWDSFGAEIAAADRAPSSVTAYASTFEAGYSPSGGMGIIHLSGYDGIRILGFPPPIIPTINDVIQQCWPLGLQSAGTSGDRMGYEWRVHGVNNSTEAIVARRLMLQIFSVLGGIGWHFVCSSKLLATEEIIHPDTLFFRPGPPSARVFFAIGFHDYDKIWIIDAPNAQVEEAIVQAINTWPKGMQDHIVREQGCRTLRILGSPWGTLDDSEINSGELLAARVLARVQELGFEMVGSIGMTYAKCTLDTWFFASKA